MKPKVILITGSPCVGKTTISKLLSKKIDAVYINLTDFAEKNNLIIGEDPERRTGIIDEENLRKKITETIVKCQSRNIVVDGHFASAVVAKEFVTFVFVLRRNPIELRKMMELNGFEGAKLWENLASEILDVSLVETLREQKKENVCELDITGQTVEETLKDIIEVIEDKGKCYSGYVDWLGMLEKKNLVEEYLRI